MVNTICGSATKAKALWIKKRAHWYRAVFFISMVVLPSVSEAAKECMGQAYNDSRPPVYAVSDDWGSKRFVWNRVTVGTAVNRDSIVVGNMLYSTGRRGIAGYSYNESNYIQYDEICREPLNSAPVVSNSLTISVDEDTTGSVTLVGTDTDGDALTYSIVSQPNTAHGSVVLVGKVATFTPKPNWNGSTSFTFRAYDGTAYSNVGTVTVVVKPVNNPPSVKNATMTLDEDSVGSLTLEVTDVDLQFEGDSHTWSVVTAPNASHGIAMIAGNKLSFTPVKDWNGTTSLTYRATDSHGENSNTAVITIIVRPVNDPPVANDRTLTIQEDTVGVVTLLATDVDRDPLTYSLVTVPNSSHGAVVLVGDKVTFTPVLNWNGTTSFTYRANDGTVYSNTATVTIVVTPVNDAPVAKDSISIKTIEGQKATVALKVLTSS